GLRREVPPGGSGLRLPPRRADGHDRLGAGPRLARADVAAQASPVRPRLHRPVVVLARPADPRPDGGARPLAPHHPGQRRQEARGVSDAPVLSVVIPTYNGRRLLETCLASVFLHRPARPGTEVVVADDASTDDTAEWLASTYPDVRVVRLERNGGF